MIPPHPPIVFTDSAADKVSSLLQKEDNPNMVLRVFIQGGGCSGFSYGFAFEEKAEHGDLSVENKGVTLIVDPMSAQYLFGAEIDYTETLAVSQFVIRNPNAATTCGCGSSFAA
jgi:iron-sulfur cluster insertion protein